MTFDEVLGQVLELLQREKRVSYRGLQRRFALDDAYLEDLKEELLFAHREITEVEGRGLVWNGETETAEETPTETMDAPSAELSASVLRAVGVARGPGADHAAARVANLSAGV